MKTQETDIYGCPLTWHDRFMDLLEDWLCPALSVLALCAVCYVGAGCMTASPERQTDNITKP